MLISSLNSRRVVSALVYSTDTNLVSAWAKQKHKVCITELLLRRSLHCGNGDTGSTFIIISQGQVRLNVTERYKLSIWSTHFQREEK